MTLDERDAVDTARISAIEIEGLVAAVSEFVGLRTREGRALQGIERLTALLGERLAAIGDGADG